jgi:ABC-type transport system substrate-binding protein
MPIGAGPFKVVSNAASASSSSLTANARYWHARLPQARRPDVSPPSSSDQSAASALEAGTDQVAELISTIPLLKSLP